MKLNLSIVALAATFASARNANPRAETMPLSELPPLSSLPPLSEIPPLSELPPVSEVPPPSGMPPMSMPPASVSGPPTPVPGMCPERTLMPFCAVSDCVPGPSRSVQRMDGLLIE